MSSRDLKNVMTSKIKKFDLTDDESFALDSSIALTKFDPSPQRAHLILRPRLTAPLDAHLAARLTLITAPAGYGKTTLLTEWRRQLKDRGVMVGWLSLDADDVDARLVSHCLAQALVRAGLNRAAKLVAKPIMDDIAVRQCLTGLLNIISGEKQNIVLILDEFEHLPKAIAEEVVLPFLEKAPANLHLVIASRELPALKIANLRPQGLIHEINAQDMRFDLLEIQTLLGDTISKAELKTLESQTSGWPVAVQLLKGVWYQQDQRRRVLRDIESLDATLTDYLSEQVFSSLPEEIFTILVKVSPIDRLSPEVVEFITGADDAWLKIMTAGALAPFLIPLDTSFTAYRTHPIIRAYFKTCLDNLPACERNDFYRKAAKWYAAAGRLVSALSYAKSAGDTALAGSMIEEAGGLTIWLRSGLPRLKVIIDILDQQVTIAFPRVKLLKAFLLVKEGNVQESRSLFEEVRLKTKDFEQDREGGNPHALKLDSLILESTLLVNEGRAASDAYLDRYERIVRRISEDDDAFLGNIKILLAISHNQRGFFDKALGESVEAIGHYRRAHLIHGEFFACLHRGTSLFALGRSAEARQVYADVRHLWRSNHNNEKTKLALLKAQNSELEYESTDRPPSMSALTETMKVFEQCEWWYDTFAAATIPLVMTLLAAQGREVALDELTRCRAIIEKRQATGLRPLLDALEISCLALSDDIHQARLRLEQFGFSPESLLDCGNNEVTWRQQEAVSSAIARVYIRDGRAKFVTPFLERVIDQCGVRGQVRSIIRLGLLKAIAQNLMGDAALSRATLTIVIKHVMTSGYIRPFIEEGQLAHELLEKYHEVSSEEESLADSAELVNRLILLTAPSSVKQEKQVLTEREIEVIQEVAGGFTDKEIARKLDLAPNTVKFHLKNIFRKLGVRNRTHAVSHGRRQGLIF